MKINLVLSGGGARGIAHLGIIKVLIETGITIKNISGVSSGAVVGSFIAAGYNPDEILKISIENKLLYQIRPVFNGGIFRITKWEDTLLKYFPKNSFEDLKIPLIINATDINECNPVFFSSGELVMPLLASCSVPGFFEPIVINQRQLVDGGVLNNLPVEPFINDKTKIIASHVNPLVFEKEIDSAFKILERCVQLSIRENMDTRKRNAFIFFEPEELTKFSIYDFDDANEIFEIGYSYASGMREKLEKLFQSL